MRPNIDEHVNTYDVSAKLWKQTKSMKKLILRSNFTDCYKISARAGIEMYTYMLLT